MNIVYISTYVISIYLYYKKFETSETSYYSTSLVFIVIFFLINIIIFIEILSKINIFKGIIDSPIYNIHFTEKKSSIIVGKIISINNDIISIFKFSENKKKYIINHYNKSEIKFFNKNTKHNINKNELISQVLNVYEIKDTSINKKNEIKNIIKIIFLTILTAYIFLLIFDLKAPKFKEAFVETNFYFAKYFRIFKNLLIPLFVGVISSGITHLLIEKKNSNKESLKTSYDNFLNAYKLLNLDNIYNYETFNNAIDDLIDNKLFKKEIIVNKSININNFHEFINRKENIFNLINSYYESNKTLKGCSYINDLINDIFIPINETIIYLFKNNNIITSIYTYSLKKQINYKINKEKNNNE